MAENPAYRVVRSERVRDQLKEWAAVAKERGLAGRFVGVLQTIEERLQEEPLVWGDPLYRLPHLNLACFRGIHDFLVVHYAVDEEKRIVFIKDYNLLPRNPIKPD